MVTVILGLTDVSKMYLSKLGFKAQGSVTRFPEFIGASDSDVSGVVLKTEIQGRRYKDDVEFVFLTAINKSSGNLVFPWSKKESETKVNEAAASFDRARKLGAYC